MSVSILTDVAHPGNTTRSLPDQSDTVRPLLNWPDLEGFRDTGLDNEPPANWMEHPCPPELHDFPQTTPADLVRILNLSVTAEIYQAREDEKELVGFESPGLPSSPVAPPPAGPSDAPRNDAASPIARSSTSLSTRSSTLSKDGVSTKSTIGKLSAKAPKEVRAISASIKGKYVLQECASCMEGIIEKNLLRLDCQHRYCLACFITLVTTAIHNENQFPPKCCLLEIPAKMILHNLENPNRDLYKEKAVEYAIPQQDRWYCPSNACGKWIAPKKLKKSAAVQKCPFCKFKICGFCRGPTHISRADCPKDAGLEATLHEAERHGWRRCYQCRAMVELVAGCRHMTCKCGAHFCYTCGAVWRTCSCTEEDQRRREEHLLARRLETFDHAQREAQELADAIAEIERLEQLETEERIRREEREAEERARQEAERARAEEARRRREEEEAREREAQRLMAIAELIRNLRLTLDRINESQQKMLNMRHETDALLLHSKIQDEKKQFDEKRQRLELALQSNVKKRTDALSATHETEIAEMTSKHEDEEDETFISISRHLKNRPNREERERSIMDKLKAAQDRELASLQKTHKEAMEELEHTASIEASSLEAGLAKESQLACPSVANRQILAQDITIDRHWFQAVTKKRADLLELHRQRLVRGENTTSERRPNQRRALKHSKPPSPPPAYPLPPPPTMLPPPTPGSPRTPILVLPRRPESPRPPPTPIAAPAIDPAPKPKQEKMSLKEMITANARNRRVNRSAFAVLSG
ncbi:predicted protein [Uncinocarpus reesii 1704]|uniref:RBR-type E3 ubiquitin transferase n=1 Tax=Uncinocarpus reesii (strain UAMH 1704) TaxID=336963 RepID=C4JH54_UNCRE|nr:uncharacterized protein UREG_02627 [Uncinocarpus reesii 1704]EEP77778.1 predicted protein [Uncinocarpus reesii 1704]